jgi:hypothetical protein
MSSKDSPVAKGTLIEEVVNDAERYQKEAQELLQRVAVFVAPGRKLEVSGKNMQAEHKEALYIINRLLENNMVLKALLSRAFIQIGLQSNALTSIVKSVESTSEDV